MNKYQEKDWPAEYKIFDNSYQIEYYEIDKPLRDIQEKISFDKYYKQFLESNIWVNVNATTAPPKKIKRKVG